MTQKDTIEKAYGNVPKEIGWSLDIFDWAPTRGIRYYWFLLKRKFTR